MRLIGIGHLRKLAFVVLMPAVVLVATGCGSFNREWKRVGQNPDAGSGLEARWEGQWIDVPDDAVITVPNLAGRTMIWPLKGASGISIRCFLPGSMT